VADDLADNVVDTAPLAPADKMRMRLWLALIDGFVENAHIDVAWLIAKTIDQHWRSIADAMYQEGFKDGQRARSEADALTDMEQQLLTTPPERTH
jgi:hypothetical protein